MPILCNIILPLLRYRKGAGNQHMFEMTIILKYSGEVRESILGTCFEFDIAFQKA